MQKRSTATLDMGVFSAFAELMGKSLPAILSNHLDIAQDYLQTIHSSLGKSDFRAISEATHPLKSSSRQIGAMKVAAFAGEIERLAGSPEPDIARLKLLAKRMEKAQAQAARALAPHIEGKSEGNFGGG